MQTSIFWLPTSESNSEQFKLAELLEVLYPDFVKYMQEIIHKY